MASFKVYNLATTSWIEYLLKPASHNQDISTINGLQTALNGKLALTGGTLTGDLYVPSVKFTYPLQNFNPFSSYKIHDSIATNMLAGKWKKLKVTWDGIENTNMARIITDQNFEQYNGDTPHGIDGDSDHVLNIDFVTNGLYGANGITYATGTLIFNFYSSPFPTAWSCRWKDKNGVWTNITLTKNGSSQLIGTLISSALYLTNIEITLSTGTGAPYVTSNIKWGLCEVEYYGNRMTLGQGALVSSIGGYISGDLIVEGYLKKGTQNVIVEGDSRLTDSRTASDVPTWAKGTYLSNRSIASPDIADDYGVRFDYLPSAAPNKPSGVDHALLTMSFNNNWSMQLAGDWRTKDFYIRSQESNIWKTWAKLHHSDNLPLALTNVNQNLEFGGVTQYFRLAFDVKTKAFIKHADGIEYEVYHSGLNDINVANSIATPKIFTNQITSDGGFIAFTGLDYLNFDGALLKGIGTPTADTDAATKNYVDIKRYDTIQTADTFKYLRAHIGGVEIQADGDDVLIYGSGLSFNDVEVSLQGHNHVTSPVQKTSSYTFVLSDADKFFYMNSATAYTFTIPLNSAVAYPVGTELHMARYGTGEVTVGYTAGVTIVSEGSKKRINVQYQVVTAKKIATDTWLLFGALKT